MASSTQTATRTPADVVRSSPVQQAPNGICYASFGEVGVPSADLERMVAAVPTGIASALSRYAYYFVPLAINDGQDTLVTERNDPAAAENAVCHRNLRLGESNCVFISTRLMEDRFSVGFEFFINVGHAFVERAGVSQSFADLVWSQVQENVRGESSLDAHDSRKQALAGDEKAKSEYFAAAFSDAIAVYMLSLLLDVDYYELREREYPLLAPAALAERLRKVNELFPPNPGYEFAIRYKRRS